MVPPFGITLAVHLISSNFGDLVAKVCECLLRRGTLPLQNIVRFTQLSQQQVRNSLLVLIQHNCVQAFALELEEGLEEASKVQTQYMVLFDNIIHRMRFPKFLAIVSKELGKQCEEVLEGLLQHGRLTLAQLIDRAIANQNEGDHSAEDALRECLIKLLGAHYVERCPVSEPFISLPTEEETSAKKRGAKSAKIIEESESIEQQALAAAAPIDAKRFSLFTSVKIDDGEKNRDNSPGTGVGEKHKHDTLKIDRESETSENEKEILWRPNFEEFIRRLRHKACIANVRARFDDGAAIVLSAVLEATRNAEKKVKTENSVPLSMNDIFEEVMKSEAGRSMTLEHVRASLVPLGCHPGGRGVDDLYSIDLKNIIHLAQSDEVESLVLKRYGRDAYRMFRLLSKTSRLMETDKISDTSFVDKKDTTKILYNLWKDDYVHMEKLVVNGPRQTQFMLWKVNKQVLWGHVLDELYHAALNLSLRKNHEMEQESELLQLTRDKRVGPIKKRYDRILKVRILLESSLMKVDDAIMLFHDF